ncbi:MAG: MFS transporter [Pseudonocardia sp.]
MADTGAQPATRMRRIAIASATGTTIEFYDFFIYGTAAALVFGKVFFPGLGDAAGTVAAFATFGVAFIARPFGAILFGHLGDRLGRKGTLVATLLLMGIATILIGLLPTAASIGIWAPILLIVLRVLQGLAVGGEWAGAVLLTAEYAPAKQRGKYALFPQLGPSLAFALASATFLITTLTMTPEAFLAYGWRIPFVGSIVLVAVGLYVRLKIEETPVFKAAAASNSLARNPLFEVVKAQPKEVLLAGGALTMLFAFFYIGVAYLTSYGTAMPPAGLGLSRTAVLTAGIFAGLTFALTTILSAIYSDRVGRRKMILIGNVGAIVLALLIFPILNIGTPLAFTIGLMLILGLVGVAYGPAGAFLPEIFATRYRYTGAGMGYNLAGILGGAVPPLFAATLAAAYGSYAIGIYLAAMGLLSTLCVLALKETKDVSLDEAEVVSSA